MTMNFVWMNNVADICGGTMQATISMIKAFPDCHHILMVPTFSCQQIADVQQELSGISHRCIESSNVATACVEFSIRPHVVVFQNSSQRQMEGWDKLKCKLIYYSHSRTSGTQYATKNRAFTVLFVSKYLRDNGLFESNSFDGVLYQPIHSAPRTNTNRCDGAINILRLCNKNPAKWELSDLEYELQVMSLSKYKHNFGICWAGIREDIKSTVDSIWESSWCHKYPVLKPKMITPHVNNRSFVNGSDIYLSASSLPETYGRTIAESQKAGCWPVVRSVGGFKEQIIDGVSGTFLTGDIYADAKALDDIILNKLDKDSVVNTLISESTKRSSLSTFRSKLLAIIRNE